LGRIWLHPISTPYGYLVIRYCTQPILSLDLHGTVDRIHRMANSAIMLSPGGIHHLSVALLGQLDWGFPVFGQGTDSCCFIVPHKDDILGVVLEKEDTVCCGRQKQ